MSIEGEPKHNSIVSGAVKFAAGGAAVVLAAGGCSGAEQQPNLSRQSLPVCAGALHEPQAVMLPPAQKTYKFNPDTGGFIDQPADDPSHHVAYKSVTSHFDWENRGAGGSGFVTTVNGVPAAVTAGHLTVGPSEIRNNTYRVAGDAALPAVWGCSMTDGAVGPDVSVVFLSESKGVSPLEVTKDQGCVDGAWVKIASVQGLKRQPDNPMVYDGIMTKVDDGHCGIITGVASGGPELVDNPTGLIQPGVSGAPVLLGGRVVAMVAGAINPEAGKPSGDVHSWTAEQVAQHTSKTIIGSVGAKYALGYVVMDGDLNAALEGARVSMPPCVSKGYCKEELVSPSPTA